MENREKEILIYYDKNAKQDENIKTMVNQFLSEVPTIDKAMGIPVVIFQDAKSNSYYIKCSISSSEVEKYLDFNARLNVNAKEAFRSNRELLLEHKTYLKMIEDAKGGREFNDIIVEYNKEYEPKKFLKIWGGQHRSKAIVDSVKAQNRSHGFRVYFSLDSTQRTELAFISNTNITVSNDTFDKMLEETTFGNILHNWCKKVGLLSINEDFPDVGIKSDKITVKLARSFIVNFYLGNEKANELANKNIDQNIYEPYLTETGTIIDEKYKGIMENNKNKLLIDIDLIEAGKEFVKLHKAQQEAVKSNKKQIENRKSFRNKALI